MKAGVGSGGGSGRAVGTANVKKEEGGAGGGQEAAGSFRKTANLSLVRKMLNKFVKKIPYTAFVVTNRQVRTRHAFTYSEREKVRRSTEILWSVLLWGDRY